MSHRGVPPRALLLLQYMSRSSSPFAIATSNPSIEPETRQKESLYISHVLQTGCPLNSVAIFLGHPVALKPLLSSLCSVCSELIHLNNERPLYCYEFPLYFLRSEGPFAFEAEALLETKVVSRCRVEWKAFWQIVRRRNNLQVSLKRTLNREYEETDMTQQIRVYCKILGFYSCQKQNRQNSFLRRAIKLVPYQAFQSEPTKKSWIQSSTRRRAAANHLK